MPAPRLESIPLSICVAFAPGLPSAAGESQQSHVNGSSQMANLCWETSVRLFCSQRVLPPLSRALPPVFHNGWSKLFPPLTHATRPPASASEGDLNCFSTDGGHQYEHISLHLPTSLILTSILSSLLSSQLKGWTVPLLPKTLFS